MNNEFQVISQPAQLIKALSRQKIAGKSLALVPTMGNLHEGHLSLVAAAKERADVVVVSIFVNPMQFGPNEDLEAYPRTLEEDLAKLAESGCQYVFAPRVENFYPQGLKNHTYIEVPEVSQGLCGGQRLGHFQGVASVVAKLFNLVQPNLAVFGQKDYQQLAVIKKMVADLSYPIEIYAQPTFRAASGLALSSRNNYLTEEEKTKASGIYATLQQLASSLKSGEINYYQLCQDASANLAKEGLAAEYVEIRNPDLTPATANSTAWVILIAARLGSTRLIDNLLVSKQEVLS